MKQVFKRKEDGLLDYTDPLIIRAGQETPEGYEEDLTTDWVRENGTRPTAEEIDAIRNAPKPKTANDLLGESLVKQKLVALKAEKARDNLGKQLVGLKLDVMKIKGGIV